METKLQPQNNYSTKDLFLASLIYAKGVKLQEVSRQGRVCWFLFENRNLCEEYQQQYFAKAVDVNAKEYTDALHTLKDIVFAEE
jgi:predicted RNA-binding protein YlxR (DUF448 family)